MKKVLALLLATVMVLSLAACGGSASKSAEAAPAAEATKEDGKKIPVIAYAAPVVGQAWWDHVQKGVEKWSEETGIEVIYKGPTDVDAAAQIQIMTDLINQNIDVLCFSPVDPEACEPILAEAREKGIIVIGTEASTMENMDWDVEAFDNDGIGGFLMKTLAEQMGEEGEYVTMVGDLTNESNNNWADSAVRYQESNYPNMKLIDDKRVASNFDAEKAYSVVKELKQKYPDLKGILGTSSFDAPGAARAIKEMGLTGEMFAISVAMPSETSNYLEDGTLKSIALWDPALSARCQLNAAVKMFNGEEIKDGTDLGEEGYHSIIINGKVLTGDAAIAITKDNYKDYNL
ncbi:MAG: substrate-binding domain-containing protein [Lachnospiraceae bacterium]|nr:substrate-binding domain-containing protein [Lachnospiraceae bacterium]